MKAIRIDRPDAMHLVEIEPPRPGPHAVVVDVAYGGICASDVEMLHGHRPAAVVRYPVVPGHEWSGVVAAVGADVDEAWIGRKVVGEGFRRCGACAPCASGEAVLCTTAYDETGFTRAGAWADQLLIAADQLHALSADADLRAAAVIEPAACAADAVLRSEAGAGHRVAVVGGGTIGALATQLLRVAGPAALVVVEPDLRRSELRRRCGATDVVEPAACADLVGQFDVVVEAAGAAGSPQLAVDLVHRGGRVVLAGIPHGTISLGVAELVTRRVEIRTVFGAPTAAWEHAVAAFERGDLDPGMLVTHEVALADAATAFALLEQPGGTAGKVLLRP